MMNYEIFKEVVAEKFMDYMSGQYKDMKLEIRPIDKVNVTLDGMNLVGEGDVTVTPTIYINDMYEHYQKTNDLQEVLQMAASKMENAIKEAPDVVPAIDFIAAKDNIVFQLVNTEQNKEMLRDIDRVCGSDSKDMKIIPMKLNPVYVDIAKSCIK